MEVQLTRKIGAQGIDMTRRWIASVSNDSGDVVVEGRALTAAAALREVEVKLQEALRAVQELRGGEDTQEGKIVKSNRSVGYQG